MNALEKIYLLAGRHLPVTFIVAVGGNTRSFTFEGLSLDADVIERLVQNGQMDLMYETPSEGHVRTSVETIFPVPNAEEALEVYPELQRTADRQKVLSFLVEALDRAGAFNVRRASDMLREFEEAIGESDHTLHELVKLRVSLIREESEEVAEALTDTDLIDEGNRAEYLDHLAKELADLIYVTYGTAERFGIDLDRAVENVHVSNMSKIGGKRNSEGKLLKNDGYVKPDMSASTKNSWLLSSP